MGESQAHINLVHKLRDYVSACYLHNDDGRILIDLPTSNTYSQTFIIDGHRPDLFVKTGCNKIIIGEAKTQDDLEREHSISQYITFLKYCSKYDSSIFILAVPWDLTISARNLLNKITNDENIVKVDIDVIDRLIV